jgi:hypothetical protein
MDNQKLTVNEEQVLNYLNDITYPVVKTNIGINVGKRSPKTAASWVNPILEKLISKGLVIEITEGKKTTYMSATSTAMKNEEPEILGVEDNLPSPVNQKVEEIDEVEKETTIELEHLQPAEKIETKQKVSKPKNNSDFNINKAKKWIIKKVEELIKDKKEWETNRNCISKAIELYNAEQTPIPEQLFQKVLRPVLRKFDPIPKRQKGEPRRNMLNSINKEWEQKILKKEWEIIKEDNTKTERSKKSHLVKLLKDSIASKLPSEKSLNSNSVKSFINTVVYEVITGNKREMKNDGRHFEVGQIVRYFDKHNVEKTGKIVRIFECKNFFQRTIVVLEEGSTKPEMKIDRKIIKVID